MTDHWMPIPQKSGVIWLTGLSGSGKSTLADALKASLDSLRIRSCILDGDALRSGLNKDLGFGPRDRQENIRRAGEVSDSTIPKGCTKRQKQDRSITLQGYPPCTNHLSLPN